MKIQKIVEIEEYKSFQNFNWDRFLKTEKFHDHVNILYGENGSGKSSICNILKNLLKGDNILDKNTAYKSFGKHMPKKVHIEFNVGDCIWSRIDFGAPNQQTKEHLDKAFFSDFWDKKLVSSNAILFFDREFVARNVHEYERKTTKGGQEQESGKLIIEFDADAISLREVRDGARRARDKQNQKITDSKDENKDILVFNLTEEEKVFFHKYEHQIKEEIRVARQELAKEKDELMKKLEVDQGLQKKASSIQNDIWFLPEVNIELLLSDYNSCQGVFDFDLEEKAKIEVGQDLVDKIKTHKSFFDIGFEIRKTHKDQCPFCQSKAEEMEITKILGIYNQIYDTNYKEQVQQFEKDKQAIIDELLLISKALTNFDLNSIYTELRRLDHNYKISGIYFTIDKPFEKPSDKNLKELGIKFSGLTKPNKENIKDLYIKAKNEFTLIKQFFADVSDFISSKNRLINKFKSDNTDEKLQSRIPENIQKIKMLADEIGFISGNKICDYKKKIAKEKEISLLEEAFQELKSNHDITLKNYENHCESERFLRLLKKMEDYLKKFNFDFRLEPKKSPMGNKSEFPFAFNVLDAEGNERDFKEGLSEGEAQVLSLCFFFAFLDTQKDKGQKILVFDDPITSLDNSNLGCLVDIIAEEEKNFSQIFILTHHRTFFKFLQKKFKTTENEKKKKGCEYNIIRNKQEFGGSFICHGKAMDIFLKLKNFEKELESLAQNGGFSQEEKAIEYGQYLRYEIENHLKNNILHWNKPNFGNIIDNLIYNDRTIAKDDLKKLKGIYSFCNWTALHVGNGDENGLTQLKEKIKEFVVICSKKPSSL